eukprot:CAMPEP_0197703770 /NCGR_PEP_ID=MMETSP1338-20131121/125604_1 /TAXON_ID=43686 ORGANISM="Pelagodinium beii, Strain RCC1491" /NCGR_SAMPLE_ID=MMETSP1338 /ASSEMBLY_ACC=CAM_ASM_000754 /LENGTH=205 /DNA_ID=CAMNT_0043287669 /DNA_START=62 /DNA_END=679 /DNA_ORIENTATION=+
MSLYKVTASAVLTAFFMNFPGAAAVRPSAGGHEHLDCTDLLGDNDEPYYMAGNCTDWAGYGCGCDESGNPRFSNPHHQPPDDVAKDILEHCPKSCGCCPGAAAVRPSAGGHEHLDCTDLLGDNDEPYYVTASAVLTAFFISTSREQQLYALVRANMNILQIFHLPIAQTSPATTVSHTTWLAAAWTGQKNMDAEMDFLIRLRPTL